MLKASTTKNELFVVAPITICIITMLHAMQFNPLDDDDDDDIIVLFFAKKLRSALIFCP